MNQFFETSETNDDDEFLPIGEVTPTPTRSTLLRPNQVQAELDALSEAMAYITTRGKEITEELKSLSPESEEYAQLRREEKTLDNRYSHYGNEYLHLAEQHGLAGSISVQK